MTHELEVKVKATADTSDLEKLKQTLEDAQKSAETFRNALSKNLLQSSSEAVKDLTEKMKGAVDEMSSDVNFKVGKVSWDNSVPEENRTLNRVIALVSQLKPANQAASRMKDVEVTVKDIIPQNDALDKFSEALEPLLSPDIQATFEWVVGNDNPPPGDFWPVEVEATFAWDDGSSADKPPRDEMPVKVLGYFEWAEGYSPPMDVPLKGVIGKGDLVLEDNVVNVLALAHVVPSSMEKGSPEGSEKATFAWDKPPEKSRDIKVLGYFEWADIEGNPPASIDLKGIVKGALELENNVVNVVAMAHIVPSSIDEGPTTGFTEPEPRGGLWEWVKNHLGFASGNVAMVAEGGEDEMVLHKNLTKGGPAVLDQYHAYLFGASNGGTVVATRDGEDIEENYNIIPRSRYAEFRSRIFRGFDGGNVASASAFGDSFSSIAGAFSSLASVLGDFDDLTRRGIPPNQMTDLVLTRIDSLKTEFSKVEDLLVDIEKSTNGMSAEAATFVSDMIKQLGPLLEGLAEDIAIETYDKFGESEVTRKVDMAVEALMNLKDMAGALSERIGKMGASVENIEEDVDVAAEAAAEASTSSTTTPGEAKKGFKQRLKEGIWDTYFTSKGDLDVDEETHAARTKARAEFSNEFVSKAFSVGEDLHTKLLQKTFGLIEQIYGKMKEASPLLQTVETLFNLAMRLFFMPLGNKLAEILIPATVELVEKVTDMWDMFDENMTLGEMFSVAIGEGVKMLSEYFFDIGDTLRSQGGLIGRVGTLIVSIGNFLEKHGESTLNFLFGIMDSVIHFFPEIIGAIVGFKVASLAQSIVNTYALAAAISQTGTLGNLVTQGGLSMLAFMGAEAVMSGAVGLVAAAATTTAIQVAMPSKHAKGGYIPSSPSGTMVLAGEGGEGEYIIPESKLGAVLRGGSSMLSRVAGGATVDDVYYNDVGSGGGGSVAGAGAVFNATYYINGYTDSELRDIIRDTVNDMTYNSRLKGRYW